MEGGREGRWVFLEDGFGVWAMAEGRRPVTGGGEGEVRAGEEACLVGELSAPCKDPVHAVKTRSTITTDLRISPPSCVDAFDRLTSDISTVIAGRPFLDDEAAPLSAGFVEERVLPCVGAQTGK